MPKFLDFDYINPVTVTPNNGEQSLETQNLKVVTTSLGAHRWELAIGLEPKFNPQEAVGKLAAHISHYKPGRTFNIATPNITGYSIANVPANLEVYSDASAGASQVFLKPVTNTWARNAVAGLFLKFQNHSKIYMLDSVDLLTSPNRVRWTIRPNLFVGISANNDVSIMPNMPVKYADSAVDGVSIGNRGVVQYTLRVVEAV